MFEQIISSLLNKYLMAFIEDVDSNQLSSSIFKGYLHLKDMRLKSTLFDDLPLPF